MHQVSFSFFFFSDMHKYFIEPSVADVTWMTRSVTAGTATCAIQFLTLAGRVLRGDRGAWSQLASLRSQWNHTVSKGQTLSTSTGPLVPNKLSDLCFLHVRQLQGLLYITCLTLNLYSFNELCFSYTSL